MRPYMMPAELLPGWERIEQSSKVSCLPGKGSWTTGQLDLAADWPARDFLIMQIMQRLGV